MNKADFGQFQEILIFKDVLSPLYKLFFEIQKSKAMFKMVHFHSLDLLVNSLLHSSSFSCSTLGKMKTILLGDHVCEGSNMES